MIIVFLLTLLLLTDATDFINDMCISFKVFLSFNVLEKIFLVLLITEPALSQRENSQPQDSFASNS